jgi:hypothetical protein
LDSIIPIQSYVAVYYNILLLVVFIVYVTSFQTPIYDSDNLKRKNTFGFFIFVFVLFYMGLRPLNFRFGDMVVYAKSFNDYSLGIYPKIIKDYVFNEFMRICSVWMSLSTFFLVCAFLYIFPLYIVSKRLFKEYWFYAFFMLVISFSFWAYGTNGIRNGIATSLFLLGISSNKKVFTVILILLALSFHKSMIIPSIAYIISLFYLDTRKYIYFWLLCIPISLALGSFLENFFLILFGEEDQRVSVYLGEFNEKSEGAILKLGFRWDFLIYSASGVFAGWYFIVKKKFDDKFYKQLFAIYLIVNGFWILIIRANFNNRFAYLSWFMLAIIILYPLLKNHYFAKQHQLIGKIILIYFMLTYFLDYISNPLA